MKNPSLITIRFCLTVMMSVTFIGTVAYARQNPTLVPQVATSVASTLTALAPTLNSLQPTRPPSATPTQTYTPTFTIEEQVAATITAVFIDATSLKTWIEELNRKHPWTDELPTELRAGNKAEADLVVKLVRNEVNVGSQQYNLCGTVVAYQIKYTVTIYNAAGDKVDSFSLLGIDPIFPSTISYPACPDQRGKPPIFNSFFKMFKKYAYIEVKN